MTFQTSLKTVFGFLNRSEYFPAPLITVVTIEESNDVYAIFPSSDPVKLIDEPTGLPMAKEEVELRPKFLPSSKIIQATDVDVLTSFGIAADNIVVGTAQQILEQLEIEIDRDQHTGDGLQRLLEAQHSWEKFVTDGENGPL